MAVDTTTAPTPPIADAARRAIPAFARGGDRPPWPAALNGLRRRSLT